MKHHWMFVAASLALAPALGCADTEKEGELEILPNQSPLSFGQMYPLGENTPEPGTTDRVPFEFVLLLETSSNEIRIEKACLVGNDNGAFEIEGPVPESPKRDEAAAIRITYDADAPGPEDHAAVVVQSNAENFPTLVVPVCAQVVAEGSEQGFFPCVSPVTVPAGASQALCP